MVQMKIDLKGSGVDVNKSSGFEPYEGPLPRPGVYAAVIRSCRVRVSQAGNMYFNVLFEFADQMDGAKQEFKGYPLWDMITPGESDIQKERTGKFLHTISGKDPSKVNIAINHDEVTDGGQVKSIGGKDPVGTKCRVVVGRSSRNGEATCELRDLFPWPKDTPWPEGAVASDDDEEIEDEEIEEEEAEEPEEEEEVEEAEEEEEEEEEESEYDARVAELNALDRTALKNILKSDHDSDFKVLKRHTDDDLREAILAIEFVSDEDEEGDDEPPF